VDAAERTYPPSTLKPVAPGPAAAAVIPMTDGRERIP
jgi:hypothetical protein